jgi:hypothetical protein
LKKESFRHGYEKENATWCDGKDAHVTGRHGKDDESQNGENQDQEEKDP